MKSKIALCRSESISSVITPSKSLKRALLAIKPASNSNHHILKKFLKIVSSFISILIVSIISGTGKNVKTSVCNCSFNEIILQQLSTTKFTNFHFTSDNIYYVKQLHKDHKPQHSRRQVLTIFLIPLNSIT